MPVPIQVPSQLGAGTIGLLATLVLRLRGFEVTTFGKIPKNGVLVLSSVTGRNRKIEVDADRLSLGFVLGNKVMVGTVNAKMQDGGKMQ